MLLPPLSHLHILHQPTVTPRAPSSISYIPDSPAYLLRIHQPINRAHVTPCTIQRSFHLKVTNITIVTNKYHEPCVTPRRKGNLVCTYCTILTKLFCLVVSLFLPRQQIVYTPSTYYKFSRRTRPESRLRCTPSIFLVGRWPKQGAPCWNMAKAR